MASSSAEEGFPSEIQDKANGFDEALAKIENTIEPLHNTPLNEIHNDINSLDKAKLDLVGVYAINSLFWMYLNVNGENPKSHGIKTELQRIQQYMGRIKELEEKNKKSSIDKDAAKRFIRASLWQQAQQKKTPDRPAQTPDRPASGKDRSIPGKATLSAAKRPGEDQSSTNNKEKKNKKHKKHKETPTHTKFWMFNDLKCLWIILPYCLNQGYENLFLIMISLWSKPRQDTK